MKSKEHDAQNRATTEVKKLQGSRDQWERNIEKSTIKKKESQKEERKTWKNIIKRKEERNKKNHINTEKENNEGFSLKM